MNDWLKQNLWGIMIAAVTLVSTYVLYGYRIGSLETEVNNQSQQIQNLNNTGVQTQISLARIQADIEYIKLQLSKIVP